MAIMLPEAPREYAPESLEGLMFYALSHLPDEYYVFHSVRINTVLNNELRECEIDFVVLNRSKGALCLEAKSGQVSYENGYWIYGSGDPMRYDGPFNQGQRNKFRLKKHIGNCCGQDVVNRCKFLNAVWFPSIGQTTLAKMSFPTEADKNLTLTKEALANPEPFLNKIYDIKTTNDTVTNLNEAEFQRIISVLCPKFKVLPGVASDVDAKRMVFNRMLEQQAGILDFLDVQYTAAIKGAAGTGKTLIAVEKATRHANDGEKVLYLCFNSQLCDYLKQSYFDGNDFISCYTIAGYACKECETGEPKYDRLIQRLEGYYEYKDSFPFKHVIVDEGQDFGCNDYINDGIETAMEWIYEIMVDSVQDGTFYVFYDPYQMVQAKKMPKFISELDCTLILNRNCRNTGNIALTSLSPLKIQNQKRKIKLSDLPGKRPIIHYCKSHEDEISRVDRIISSLSATYSDIVILTMTTEAQSVLFGGIVNGKYKNKYRFTTCRKFKGLEADAIILVDVDKSSFDQDNILLFYVGASRARFSLDITAILDADECNDIIKTVLNPGMKITNSYRDFASSLQASASLKD